MSCHILICTNDYIAFYSFPTFKRKCETKILNTIILRNFSIDGKEFFNHKSVK